MAGWASCSARTRQEEAQLHHNLFQSVCSRMDFPEHPSHSLHPGAAEKLKQTDEACTMAVAVS